MKSSTLLNRYFYFFFLTFLLLLSSCEQSDQDIELTQDEELIGFGSEPIEGQYIVFLSGDSEARKSNLRYKEGTELMKQDILAKFPKMKLAEDDIIYTYGYSVNGFTAKLDNNQLELLQKDVRVKYIEQDQMISLAKPPWAGGGGDTSTGQETPWGITRVNGGVDATGKTAWVIDSGIDLDHPDLNVDVGRSRSFLSGKDANDPNDTNGHGTHVAGTIAAIDNEEGVVGVAAGATVVSVRVLNRRGSGSYSGVIAGVDYVGSVGQAGDVANMSLGGGASEAVDNAVIAASNQKGVIFCVAAGNDSSDANNYSPARANGPNIVTVSASDSSDRFASFSNYGNPPIDWCAPGVSVKSTWKNGEYNTISGTSMATPHVAGVLLIGVNNGASSAVSNDPDGNADMIISH